MARFLTSAPVRAQRYWTKVAIEGFSSLQWDELAEFAALHCQGDIALHEEARDVPSYNEDARDIMYAFYRDPRTPPASRAELARSLSLRDTVLEPCILFQNREDLLLFKLFFPEQLRA